ncbi:hypothetical protein E2C01_089197 [Portunus trituberculatus]|uniref:Uncharacterized protein n=1 Tax=Portunus trituberculatus TaxID=210409 RepID=A0A5B7JLK6_PORTR|nr:hypothetical protein [Portunus trituberculatus]
MPLLLYFSSTAPIVHTGYGSKQGLYILRVFSLHRNSILGVSKCRLRSLSIPTGGDKRGATPASLPPQAVRDVITAPCILLPSLHLAASSRSIILTLTVMANLHLCSSFLDTGELGRFLEASGEGGR